MTSKINEYVSKATTTLIKASSRASIKISESYYTVEYCEERSIPEDCDIEKERTLLWDTANSEVDSQIEEILQAYGNKRK